MSACLAVALFGVFSAFAATVRSKSDLRLWETVTDRSRPIEWPWEESADSATLTFSNRVTRAASTVEVVRATGERRGMVGSPRRGDRQPGPLDSLVTQPGVETLVDVTLVQTVGGVEVARETATLAYVSGAGGGPITVRAVMGAPERELAKVQEPRVYAFDPAWLGEAGESGYDIAWPMYRPLKIILR